MIACDPWLRRRQATLTLESLTVRGALLIGMAQCLSLWPGTSRAMVTMLAGMLLGLPAAAAAEYSFLLALPTLGAATLFDAVMGGGALASELGVPAVIVGFVTAAIVAAVAMRGLISYLTRHGLAVFGWYRIALAGLVWWVVRY
jgi:undecaprenyl-diphosphatase